MQFKLTAIAISVSFTLFACSAPPEMAELPGDGLPAFTAVSDEESQQAVFDETRAYVPTISTGSISALDLENNKVLWKLQVSEGTEERKPESAMGIAATRDGKTVFAGDAVANELVVVDAEKQKIVKRIPLDHGIHAIDICPHDHLLAVSGRLEGYSWLTAMTLVDVQTLEKVGNISPALGNSAHFAFTPDGKEIWAASVTTNLVWVINAEKKEVVAAIPMIARNLEGGSPEGGLGLIGFNEVTISPDGKRAYVVGPEIGVIFAIDVATRKIVGSVDVGERTHGVAVTRDGKEVWTANNAGSVSIVDAGSLELLDTIPMKEHVGDLTFTHVAFSVDGTKAYLAWAEDITVIDVATRKLLATIPVEAGPHEISLEDYYNSVPEIERKATPGNQGDNGKANGEFVKKQESKAGGVTITATLETTEFWDDPETLEFEVALNTHSGDLMEHDLEKITTVLVDGQVVEAELKWEGDSESSHHRKGTLTVSLSTPIKKSLKLKIEGVAVAERVLEWKRSE